MKIGGTAAVHISDRNMIPIGHGDIRSVLQVVKLPPRLYQQEIFKQLELEKIGISLTETFIMQPEKSVTAFALVNNGAIQ